MHIRRDLGSSASAAESRMFRTMTSTDSDGDSQDSVKLLPDSDLLFPPFSPWIRELHNNQSQLRDLMKPRYMEYIRKKPACLDNDGTSSTAACLDGTSSTAAKQIRKKPAAKQIQKKPAEQVKKKKKVTKK